MSLVKLLLLLLFTSSIFTVHAQNGRPGPHVLVYKTYADYSHLVPVILSADKKSLVSYPDPKDLKRGNTFTLPVKLHKGYLLDRQGINKNVAFLKMSYAEYAALPKAPTAEEIMAMLIDKDPLVMLWDCGLKSRHDYGAKELNSLIDKNKLGKTCKSVK